MAGQLAYIYPVSGTVGGTPEHPIALPPNEIGGGPIYPGHPGGGPIHPGHPGGGPVYPVPPLPPGIWPSPGQPTPPIAIPPAGIALPPIYIPDTPEHPIAPPPGTVWPPLEPGDGLAGKVLALVWVVGIGYKWLVLEAPAPPPGVWPTPPVATPKR